MRDNDGPEGHDPDPDVNKESDNGSVKNLPPYLQDDTHSNDDLKKEVNLPEIPFFDFNKLMLNEIKEMEEYKGGTIWDGNICTGDDILAKIGKPSNLKLYDSPANAARDRAAKFDFDLDKILDTPPIKAITSINDKHKILEKLGRGITVVNTANTVNKIIKAESSKRTDLIADAAIGVVATIHGVAAVATVIAMTGGAVTIASIAAVGWPVAIVGIGVTMAFNAGWDALKEGATDNDEDIGGGFLD